MKEVTLDTAENMLFALLRASLHDRGAETSFFMEVSDEDWRQCYKIATRHGVMALAWDGVRKLPAELQPCGAVKLTWALAVEAYEKKYRHYCRTVDELSNLYAEHGISLMQLKGVGLSALYPVPSHREGGDIDIYTFSSDKNKMSDAQANELADELMRERGIDVSNHSCKHSFFYFNGVPIENHKTFLNIEKFKYAAEAEKILVKNISPQLTILEEGKVLTPSPSFNLLFIAFHSAQHYGSGLALHHLCDWAVLISRFGLSLPEISNRPLLNGIYAMTYLCNRYLGTALPVEYDASLAEEMICEILHPRYSTTIPLHKKSGIVLYKTRRLLYSSRIQRRILSHSLASRLWSSILFHIRNPKTIFN